jgi:integrase
MYADAIEDGTVRHNPARVSIKRTTWPSEEVEAKPKALTRAELSGLLAALPHPWRPFFEFLAHTGLRISEAIALTWGDVEFGKRPAIRVRTQVYRGERKRLKSDHSRRTIPLSPGMARTLWQAQGAAQDRSEAAPVFSTITGEVLQPSNVGGRILKPAAKPLGLEWVGFHTFRHTCASLLFEGGKDVKQVQEWLGHADPGLTLRTYIHLLDGGLGAADFLDDAITREGGDGQPATISEALEVEVV